MRDPGNEVQALIISIALHRDSVRTKVVSLEFVITSQAKLPCSVSFSQHKRRCFGLEICNYRLHVVSLLTMIYRLRHPSLPYHENYIEK